MSLEEMDTLFGSIGFAAADEERMREIAKEVGIDDAVRGTSISREINMDEKPHLDEKKEADSD